MNQTVASGPANITVDEFVRRFQLFVNVPTFILGLVFNAFALWSLCFRFRRSNVSVIYMMNLIMADILLLFSLPFKIYAYQTPEWSLGPAFCMFLECLYYVNTYASILMTVLICLDRYISIKHPFLARSFRSPRKTAAACATVWIGVWSCSACIYFIKTAKPVCFFNHNPSFWKSPVVLILQSLFVLSALVMVFCSVQIVRALRRISGAKEGCRDNSKSVNIVLSNLSTFLVCFTPYHLAMLLYFLARNSLIPAKYLTTLRNALQICLCLANINCVLDAIYYYFVFKEFRKSHKHSPTDR
ncbi:G-protein coupled receptor 55-like [Leucoraja erinacea]|uniref:G-protein coupled receptor 55-like n=1 Tax=Leucoraja erinaceus TaxID=7782 RepID=UPI002455CA59|nr:G-protein coupled receptor 55-like [Leucoraja erinacea]